VWKSCLVAHVLQGGESHGPLELLREVQICISRCLWANMGPAWHIIRKHQQSWKL